MTSAILTEHLANYIHYRSRCSHIIPFSVEHVKVHCSLSYEGIYPHLEHMKVSMQSALVGRKELRPVFGLLICEGAVITEYGYIRDN